MHLPWGKPGVTGFHQGETRRTSKPTFPRGKPGGLPGGIQVLPPHPESRPAKNPEFWNLLEPGKLVFPRGKPILLAACRLSPGETPGFCLVARIEIRMPPPCFFVPTGFPLFSPWCFPRGKPAFPWGKPGETPRETSQNLLFCYPWFPQGKTRFSPRGNQV